MAKVFVHQWSFLGLGQAVMSGQGVTLRHLKIDESIRYGDRENGIDLVWDEAADLGNVSLHQQGTAAGPVTFGEPIALRIEGEGLGGFVCYKKRSPGIELDWSTIAVYEWEIAGGAFGRPVPMGGRIGLYNRTFGDYLVYGHRYKGINLRWWSHLARMDIGNGEPFLFGGTAATLGDPLKSYPPLVFPPEMRGPHREPGQILLSGTVSELELIHGLSSDELDWHIYITLDPGVRNRLEGHLATHYGDPPTLDRVYSELTVLDLYSKGGYDRFYSADLTTILGLSPSAWEWSAETSKWHGQKIPVSGSTLHNAWIWLQGAFVCDLNHGFQVEIHPLDSLAYALDEHGPIKVPPSHAAWPRRELTWRVAAFSNSSLHRINKADYLKRPRTSTWYLPLPTNVTLPVQQQVTVTARFPGFANKSYQDHEVAGGGRYPRPTSEHYQDYGVQVQPTHEVVKDPRAPEDPPRLRVSLAMAEPDEWGGMFLAEYKVRVSQVDDPNLQ
jgi:hypothetical protein